MLKLNRLPCQPLDWDALVRTYPQKTAFHESGWLKHLKSIHPDGELAFFEIVDGSSVVGHHCGLELRKLGVPIHGSPLGGTGTNYLGPLVREGADPHDVLVALSTGLLGIGRAWQLELASPWIAPEVARPLGFATHEDVTHLVDLPDSVEAAWANLKGTCRNRVRKAQSQGLTVETVDDPVIVDHFFAQFTEVYGKQGMVTPFGKERPQSLFDILLPAGRLLPLWVRKGDEVLATGLFPFDEHCIYFWGAASWLRHQHLSPNELLHWEVIRFAVTQGIPSYNMCGGHSQFKDKFGGADVPYVHFSKSALPGLPALREAYRRFHYWKLRQRGG